MKEFPFEVVDEIAELFSYTDKWGYVIKHDKLLHKKNDSSKWKDNVAETHPLLSPSDLKHELPNTPAISTFVEESRQAVKNILEGKDPRYLLIVGPCSIHDPQAAKEYAQKIHQLSLTVSDTFLIIMRAYFEKPRTSLGWKGMLYDPYLDGSNDIATGMRWTRQLLLDLAEMQVPTATEFLDPATPSYIGDLISWACIGARTTSSQTHRQVASGLSIPIAFKNSTDGNVDTAINGVLSAASPHTYIGINQQGGAAIVHTKGNPHCHITLRGAECGPNYDPQSINQAIEKLDKANLPKHLLVDCSHDNSNRKHEQQAVVFQSIIHQIMEGNKNIRGALIESHINAGNQPLDYQNLKHGVSLTDPCLDWSTTESLIKWAHTKLIGDLCVAKQTP